MGPALSLPRRRRIATRKSSSSCSPASIITSPHNTTTPSASGPVCSLSTALTPGPRAYIERARSALAERQRESEELLQSGVAAFQRGDGDEARRLVQAAIDGGAPTGRSAGRARSAESPPPNLAGRRSDRASAPRAECGGATRGQVARPVVGAHDCPPVRPGVGGRGCLLGGRLGTTRLARRIPAAEPADESRRGGCRARADGRATAPRRVGVGARAGACCGRPPPRRSDRARSREANRSAESGGRSASR